MHLITLPTNSRCLKVATKSQMYLYKVFLVWRFWLVHGVLCWELDCRSEKMCVSFYVYIVAKMIFVRLILRHFTLVFAALSLFQNQVVLSAYHESDACSCDQRVCRGGCSSTSDERIVEPRSSGVDGHCVARKPLSFSRVALVCGVARRVHFV